MAELCEMTKNFTRQLVINDLWQSRPTLGNNALGIMLERHWGILRSLCQTKIGHF